MTNKNATIVIVKKVLAIIVYVLASAFVEVAMDGMTFDKFYDIIKDYFVRRVKLSIKRGIVRGCESLDESIKKDAYEKDSYVSYYANKRAE